MNRLKSTFGLIIGLLFLVANFHKEVQKQNLAKQIKEEKLKLKNEQLLTFNKENK